MSISSPQIFPPSTEGPAGQGGVRTSEVRLPPTSGSASSRENTALENVSAADSLPQDEVKVQWDSSDQIVVYQFVNQQGSLVLQVPSEQVLNLARQISQELAKEAAPKAASGAEGEKAK